MDELDRKIVELLESDGRLGYADLARRLSCSRASAAARTQRLIRSGTVDVKGVLNPAVLGLHALGYAMIRQSGAAFAVATAAAQLPETAFVSVVTGPASVIAEVRAPDEEVFAATIDRVRAVPGVRSVRTLTYARVLRDAIGPVGAVAGDIDDRDRAILRELQVDGRIPYARLAHRVGVSSAAARRRVLSLVERGAVKFGSVRGHADEGAPVLIEAGVRATGTRYELAERLATVPGVIFCAETFGDYDILLTVRAETLNGLSERLDTVRGVPGVAEIEPWAHLTVVKEEYLTNTGF